MTSKNKNYGLVVLGATSSIAEAYVRLVAKERGSNLTLFIVGRNAEALESIAADVTARGAGNVVTRACDLAAIDDPATLVAAATGELGTIDEVLIAYGSLPDQSKTQTDPAELEKAFQVNFTSTAIWLQAFANVMTEQKFGRLAVIGSVAGDRGRMSNYAYGAAKGGLERFVQGLQHALAAYPNVSATLIKPGFVATPMTAHIEGRGGPLWATPERIAADIDKAVKRRKLSVYAPWFWWGVMTIIRSLPAAILHKTKL
ncbi:SDR family NAD(P)-dependent oxidoreductase (plasmid) [Rhodobacteraceae bacterium SC52]|nr:SDR family NAD(P)-dependent oxidoreductase [Rhodobacteraceae bacterium SC52]